MTNCILYMIL